MRIKSLSSSLISMILVVSSFCACGPDVPEITPAHTLPTRTNLPTIPPTETATSAFGIQSEMINEILEQGPPLGHYLVYGTVRFSVQPIPYLTDMQPDFWVRDENAGNPAEVEEVYDPLTGEYLYTFIEGEYGISADVVLGEVYPSPGDYTSFTVVKVNDVLGIRLLRQDIQLTRIIHMTSPFDNLEPWDAGFERVKMWDTPLLKSRTVRFEWDAIPEAYEYLLTITEVELNPDKNLAWDNIQVPVDTRLFETSYTVELPSSPEDHFYSARLYAKDQVGNYIGNLMFRLKNGGWGWDVRFRVP